MNDNDPLLETTTKKCKGSRAARNYDLPKKLRKYKLNINFKLVDILYKRGLSLGDLAKMTGINKSTFSRANQEFNKTNNRKLISLELSEAICNALDIDFYDLWDISVNKKQITNNKDTDPQVLIDKAYQKGFTDGTKQVVNNLVKTLKSPNFNPPPLENILRL